MDEWIAGMAGAVTVTPAAATAIAFVRCHLPIGSVALADRIRERASVLVAPGALLGAEHHLRITVGYEPEKVREALDRITRVIREMRIED